eukprot:3844181-Amphidinium_carterae.2
MGSEGQIPCQIVEQAEEVTPSTWLDVCKFKGRTTMCQTRTPSGTTSLLIYTRRVVGSYKVAVDHRFAFEVADVQGAFTQTYMSLSENARMKKVHIKIPWQGLTCFPGARIVELLCWIYGLSSAPLAWRIQAEHDAGLDRDGFSHAPNVSECVQFL